ncbi:sulfurtransferase complex subunit TusD [Gynuella sp.]|uniref:sulfurtransferase complex subunit TusD n=1 Tax=Gynuella sp. TaxID=2969146 RepID=UPI003D100E7B
MNYSVTITAPPYLSENHETAFAVCETLLTAGHTLTQVFFYADAVTIANTLTIPHQNETNWQQAWVELASQHDVDLIICVAAALRRGVVNEQEAHNNQLPYANCHPGFTISGLGEWVTATAMADRHLVFK